MGKRIFPSLLLYLPTMGAILCWWYAAFICSSHSAMTDPPSPQLPEKQTSLKPPSYLSYLSPMERNLLREALCGNIPLMTKLMVEWDVDAQILENHGLIGVKRLPRQEFIKAQMIGRQLERKVAKTLPPQEVQDDNGKVFRPKLPLKKFLPQTYVAASFLLALTGPDNIVAIPRGFREQTQLYPSSVTDKIVLDADRYNSEEIFQNKPDIAFVAHYSLPSTLEALRNQGVPLFTLKSINTLPEISGAIHKVGKVIHRPLEAELLTLFMESAMLAIDNRILAMRQALTEEHGSPKVMFLSYHTQYFVPTNKTIAGQLLERLQSQHKFTLLSAVRDSHDEWMIPIEQENIVHFNPDCMIIASSNSEALKAQIRKSPSFSQISANKQNKIYFVDGQVFESPTQHVVLAYFDLAKVLVDATSPYSR